MNQEQLLYKRLSIGALLLLGTGMGYGLYHLPASVSRLNDALWQGGWAPLLRVENKAFIGYKCMFDPTCRPYLLKGIQLYTPYWILLANFGMVLLWAFWKGKSTPKLAEKSPGGAEWVNDDLLIRKKYLDVSPKDRPTGYLGVRASGKAIFPKEEHFTKHVLVVGGTGSGKSSRILKQMIFSGMQRGSTVIVFDLKGDATSGFYDMVVAAHSLKRPIYIFNPFSTNTMSWNILARGLSKKEVADLSTLIYPRPEGEKDSDFYKNLERSLLKALIHGKSHDTDGTMADIYAILEGGLENVRDYCANHPVPAVKRVTQGFERFNAQTLQGLIEGLASKLDIFDNPNLARATSHAGKQIDFEKLLSEPSFLYIRIPEDEIQDGKGRILLQMLYRLIQRTIRRVADRNYGRLPVHVMNVMDEFVAFKRITNLREDLGTIRSRRVTNVFAMQNLAQGEAEYQKDWPAIVQSFQQLMLIPEGLRMEDLEYFSNLLQKITVLDKTKTRSKSMVFLDFGSRRQGETARESERPLLSPAEMQKYPEGKAVAMLVGGNAEVYLPYLSDPTMTVIETDGTTVTVKNPFYKAYHAIFKGMEPYHADKTIEMNQLNRLYPRIESIIQGVCGSVSPTQLLKEQRAEEQPELFFLDFIGKLIGHKPEVTFHRTGKRAERVVLNLSHQRIPSRARDAETIRILRKISFISFDEHNQLLTVLSAGLDVLRAQPTFKDLEALEHLGLVHSWIFDNAAHIEGHPKRNPEVDVVGMLEGETVLRMVKTEAKAIFGDEITKDFKESRIATRVAVTVPLDTQSLLKSLARTEARLKAEAQPKAAAGGYKVVPKGGNQNVPATQKPRKGSPVKGLTLGGQKSEPNTEQNGQAAEGEHDG